MLPTTRRPLALLVALIAWGALGLQLAILVQSFAQEGKSIGEALMRFVSFFTILTNLLVAIVTTFSALDAAGTRRCSKPFLTGATAMFIIMVAIVYHLVLSALWDPRGAQLLADRLLHTAVPAAFVIWWLVAIPKGDLVWPNAFVWLVYPLGYAAAISALAAVNGFYPYPFIDPAKHGAGGVLANVLFLSGAFLALGLLFVALDEVLRSRRASG